MRLLLILLHLSFFLATFTCNADEQIFSDKSLTKKVILPDWFKLSFLDLKDDLDEAIAGNKKGIILYFGSKDCPYCKAFIDNNWQRKDIVRYTRKNFDVIAIDTKGKKNITDFNGLVYGEKEFSHKIKTNFTPSLLFFDGEGNNILRLSGYQQPYRFMAALEYIAGNHFHNQSFKSYYSLAKESIDLGGKDELNSQNYFDSPPHNLNRTRFKSSRPLAVFFENKNCHACDILHSNPLSNNLINNKLEEMDVIQLDITSPEKIITPKGQKTNVINWTKEIDVYYTPTIMFFDESGNEIIRIDSVVWVNRLGRVLDYIKSKAYNNNTSFQQWRSTNN